MFETLGHYKILDRIGAGGMGEVYRARDTRLGRTVALKVIAPSVADDPDRRERFLREARATAALSHPHIAALYEIGEDQGQRFLVFEFVAGRTLETEIGGHAMNPRRAIELAIQIADALADAHAEGIVHRDIKPDNIIVTPKGNAKVLDFGLATWTAGGAGRDEAATVLSTGVGTMAGAAAYMSPEQALGERVDHRTDIFSLGIVLFEMLTGALPFKGPTTTAVVLQIVQAPAPAVTSINRSLPAQLDPIVAKALAKSLDERYGSAATFAAELRTVLTILDVRSRLVGPPVTPSPPAARRQGALVVLVLLGIAILGALAVFAFTATASPIRRSLAHAWRDALGSRPAPVIAVMPLESDSAQIFFADGLTEDLITRLGETPGLKVLGRSATRAYRGHAPQDVARELGAAVVLTGSVRPSGDVVQVSLELVDPSDGTALWAHQYTRDVKDIFAVQALVADDVAQALRVKLEPTAASARAASRLVDRRAYEAYLRGRQAAAERRLTDARRLYEEAIHLDDGLAEAHGGLAEVLSLEPTLGVASDDRVRRARLTRAAGRAYELDPDAPQANLAMGLATDRLIDRLTYLKKSIATDASYSEGYHQIGDQIADFDPDRAIAFYRRALALDPRMTTSSTDIVTTLAAAGRFDEANGELAAASTEPHVGLTEALQIGSALDEHRYAAALTLLRNKDLYLMAPVFTVEYVAALRASGQGDQAYAAARKMVHESPGDCEGAAVLAALLSERKQTAAARQLVASNLRRAEAPDDLGPVALRCIVLAAAAIDDAQGAASLVARIAGDERLLRDWTLDIMGLTGGHLLRRALYPWSRVAERPPVVEARRALDRAYARARQEGAGVLADVTPQGDAPRRHP